MLICDDQNGIINFPRPASDRGRFCVELSENRQESCCWQSSFVDGRIITFTGLLKRQNNEFINSLLRFKVIPGCKQADR